MIIVYKTSGLTYRIGKVLVKLKNIGMANIILGESVVPELVQKDVNSNKIYGTGKIILNDDALFAKMKNKLAEIKLKLGDKDASANAAKSIYYLMNET